MSDDRASVRALILGIGALGLILGLGLMDLVPLYAGVDRLSTAAADRPLLSAFLFCCMHVLIVSLFLPVAAPLAIAAGAVFGFGRGLLLIVIASLFAAALGFLVSRYLFATVLRRRFLTTFQRIDAAFSTSGMLHLFALRLIPLVPFCLINIGMGLTKMSFWHYLVVTLLGGVPNAALFVHAGAELGALNPAEGVVTPGVLLALAFIGLSPWMARQLIDRLQVHHPDSGAMRRPSSPL
ncbi:TVP38/TMEM64 family protein [Halochromatium sp.]